MTHDEAQLRNAVVEVMNWLSQLSSDEERAFYSQLAVNLTVGIRSSLSPPVESGTIQLLNEFLHVVIGRIADEDRRIDNLPSRGSVLDAVGLAYYRARDFDPPPDVSHLIRILDLTMSTFIPPRTTS